MNHLRPVLDFGDDGGRVRIVLAVVIVALMIAALRGLARRALLPTMRARGRSEPRDGDATASGTRRPARLSLSVRRPHRHCLGGEASNLSRRATGSHQEDGSIHLPTTSRTKRAESVFASLDGRNRTRPPT